MPRPCRWVAGRAEVGQPEGLAAVLDPVPEHVERPALVDLVGDPARDGALRRGAVHSEHLRPLRRARS